jgi:hypothetical protein
MRAKVLLTGSRAEDAVALPGEIGWPTQRSQAIENWCRGVYPWPRGF